MAQFQQDFEEAMDDDINTPEALAAFQQLRATANHAIREGLSEKGRQGVREVFRRCGRRWAYFSSANKSGCFVRWILVRTGFGRVLIRSIWMSGFKNKFKKEPRRERDKTLPPRTTFEQTWRSKGSPSKTGRMGVPVGSDRDVDRLFGIHAVNRGRSVPVTQFVKILLAHRGRQYSQIIRFANIHGIPCRFNLASSSTI